MSEPTTIVDQVEQIGRDVSVILMIIRGSEDFGPGLTEQIKANREQIQKLADIEERRHANERGKMQLGAMLLTLAPVLALAYQVLVISDMRHALSVPAWQATLAGAALLLLLIGIVVQAIRILDVL